MKTIGIAVVGLGRLGGEHAKNVARRVHGAELVAICDADPGRLREYGDMLDVPHRFADIDGALALDEVDAVVLVSPSVFHCDHIARAVRAGKHVFSEKPLGVTVEECLKTEKLVSDHAGQTFMLGFMRRFDESYAYAHQKVAAGEIGDVILFRGYSQDPDAFVHEAIRFSGTSGGIFMDMAIHDIDLARWFIGSEPEKVWAIGACYAYPEFAATGDVDNASCLMKFNGGAMAFLFAGRTAPHGYNVEAEIIGTKGILRISNVPQKNLVEILDRQGVRKECFQRFDERFAEAYRAEVQYFVDCLREGKKPWIAAADGTRATQIAYKCKESFSLGREVETLL